MALCTARSLPADAVLSQGKQPIILSCHHDILHVRGRYESQCKHVPDSPLVLRHHPDRHANKLHTVLSEFAPACIVSNNSFWCHLRLEKDGCKTSSYAADRIWPGVQHAQPYMMTIPVRSLLNTLNFAVPMYGELAQGACTGRASPLHDLARIWFGLV